LDGLSVPPQTVEELLKVDPGDWGVELENISAFLAKFGDRLPEQLRAEEAKLAARLGKVGAASR